MTKYGNISVNFRALRRSLRDLYRYRE